MRAVRTRACSASAAESVYCAPVAPVHGDALAQQPAHGCHLPFRGREVHGRALELVLRAAEPESKRKAGSFNANKEPV